MTTPWALAAALTNAAGVWRGLYSHRLSHPVLRIALHSRPFRGSVIVPTILSFLSRALNRPSTLIYEGIPRVGLFLIHCAECEHQSSLVLSIPFGPHSSYRVGRRARDSPGRLDALGNA